MGGCGFWIGEGEEEERGGEEVRGRSGDAVGFCILDLFLCG